MDWHDETEEENASPERDCDKCGQTRDRTTLQVCPFCQKSFCRYCAVRMGNKEYCSRACGQGMFLTEEEDDPLEEEV